MTSLHRSLAVVLLLTVLLGWATPADAEEQYPNPADGTITMVGSGYGHGRGMSQYGAYRAGSLGVSGEAITDRYYAGSTVQAVGNAHLRVRLAATVNDREVRFPAVAGLTARDEATQAEQRIDASTFPSATLWRVVTDASGLRVQWASGNVWNSISIGGRDAFTGTVRVYSNQQASLALTDEDGGTRSFRGNYRIVRFNGSQLAAVNIVTVEDYLRAVVPGEVPATWPAGTVDAQSIAARSYAHWHLGSPRGTYYDICDTASCQVYPGTSAEHPSSTSAVVRTAGRVRTVNGAVVRAEFSSSNGSWIEAGAAGHAPPGYDSWTDGTWDPSRLWRVEIPAADLAAMVGSGHQLVRLDITQRDGIGNWGGRVRTAVIRTRAPGGASATKTVTGDDIRRRFGLRSTMFTVEDSTSLRWQTTTALGTAAPWSTYTYGPTTATPLMGDWDGDGVATAAVVGVEGGELRWRMSGSLSPGAPQFDFRYGPASCRPVAGDWDGNGTDTPGIVCPTSGEWRWRLSNVNGRSSPVHDFRYGPTSGIPLTGDWDGVGGDGFGVVRPGGQELLWQLRDVLSGGAPARAFNYGAGTDTPVVGDWAGIGASGVGIVRMAGTHWTWRLRDTATPGGVTASLIAGRTDQLPMVTEGNGSPGRPGIVG